MNRDSVDWRGYFAAVPTPFNDDGSLAPDLLRELLGFYIEQGLHGVLINGTTGEWFSQSAEERRRTVETAIEAVGGRIPVIVGCTSYTANEVIAFARHAMDAGAAGFASTPPPYCKPFPDETYAFYEDIANGLPDAPMMIYNWPHGTSVEIGTELALRLIEIDTVVAFKDSTPDQDQFFASAKAVHDRVRTFGPYMSRRGLAELRAHGGDGTIGGGCLFGRPDPEFRDAVWRGEDEAALAHAARTEELFPKLWLPGKSRARS